MAIYTIQSDRNTERLISALRRQARTALVILTSTIFISTLGFVLLGKHEGTLQQQAFLGFWDTLNLVSTVGSLHPEMTNPERAWSLMIIIVGLGAVLYGFGIMQNLFHSGEILQFYARRKMKRAFENLSGHIVLCGYGGVGRAVAVELKKAGLQLLVIDSHLEAIEHADEHGHLAIHADCTEEATLHQAGLDRAGGLIATLDHDAANVYLILLAREQNPDLRIVSRADKSETRSTLQRAGADRVIVPGETAALQLSHLILKPNVSEFIAAATGDGDFVFAELAAKEYPRLSGKTLRELDLSKKAEMIVITLINDSGKHLFNPSPDHVIKETDTLIVVCKEDSVDHLATKL